MDGETYGIGILWGQGCVEMIPYEWWPDITCRRHLNSVRFQVPWTSWNVLMGKNADWFCKFRTGRKGSISINKTVGDQVRS
jgi:hypothetical protein